MTLLMALTLAMLALLNGIYCGRYLYPPVIFCGVWSLLLTGVALSGSVFYPLSDLSLIIFFTGGFAFSVGGMVVLMVMDKLPLNGRQHAKPMNFPFLDKFLNLGLAAQIVIAPFYLRQLLHMSSLANTDSFLVGLRMQTVVGSMDEVGFGVFAYVVALVTFSALVAFYEQDGTTWRRIRAWIYISMALTYQLLTAARTGAALAVISLGIIAAMKSGRSTARTTFPVLVGFLLVFCLPAILLSKGGSVEQTFGENVVSLGESLRDYALPGVVAFDQRLSTPEPDGGWKSFRFFQAVARAVGAKTEVAPAILDYTFTPIPTNVYTMYYFIHSDFGLAGTALLLFLLGALCSLIYVQATCGDRPSTILYGMIATSLLLSGMNEPFLSAASFWIQAVAFLTLVYSRSLNGLFSSKERRNDYVLDH